MRIISPLEKCNNKILGIQVLIIFSSRFSSSKRYLFYPIVINTITRSLNIFVKNRGPSINRFTRISEKTHHDIFLSFFYPLVEQILPILW